MRPDDPASACPRQRSRFSLPAIGTPVRAFAAMLLGTHALLPPAAHALQLLDVRDGVAIEAIVSIKEPTRIRIEGAPITDVFGNIHSSGCAPSTAATNGIVPNGIGAPPVNPSGEFVLECDRDKGEIFIRPVGDSTKPVNLFVSSARATYTLVLRRADTPADTIVLRDRTQRAAIELGNASADASETRTSGPAAPAPTHVRALKALLVAMASERVPPEIHVDEVGCPVQLWHEAAMTLLRRYEGRGLVGEKYLLRNTSPSDMVLAEQEFDRPDSREGGQVLAVAVENQNLRPGETTQVFVIRRGGQ